MQTSAPTMHRLSPSAITPRQPVAARPRDRRVVWCAACLVCGGLLGLVLAVVGTLRSERPSRRLVLVVVTGAAVQLVCAGAFATVAVAGELRSCPPSRALPDGGGGPWQTVRTAVNAPVSGAALLYGMGRGGEMYRCADNGTTAVILDSGFARAGTMYGTVFLSDQHAEAASPRMRRLSEHEARHADQWAVSSLLAGPAGFPLLYAADEALFPGSYNHFERQAGLADGGYDPPPDSPPAAGRLAFLVVGLIAGYSLTARGFGRRAPARPGGSAQSRIQNE